MGLSRLAYRAVFLAVVLVSASILLVGALTAPTTSTDEDTSDFSEPVVPPRDDITVVATDSNVWLSGEGDGPRANSELVAFDTDGSMLYYNDSHDRYWDVDRSPDGETTVYYTASIHLSEDECSATTACTRNVIERVDLTTGAVERLYSQVTAHKHSSRWHDVDRINETHYVVADIHRDRVFVVDVETGLETWVWNAQDEYPLSGGGPFPRDWTHVNDVDVLDDGRFMVSLRNQDQVVFLDPERGLQEDWTLGDEDDHDVIYEQHNPDYIPEEQGGPAVLVADSENSRVVEYQRTDGEWERTWEWSDRRMQWPRDADRLPNGHTLITDSNGNRVFEVDRDGEIVWSIDIGFPYEAERLESGSGSTNGSSADELGLQSVDRSDANESTDDEQQSSLLPSSLPRFQDVLPGPIGNAVAYVLPFWMGTVELLAAIVLVVASLVWLVFEAYWSRWSVGFRRPVVVHSADGRAVEGDDGGGDT